MHLLEVTTMAKFKPVRIVKTEYGTYSLHFTTPVGRRRRLSVGNDYQYAQRLAVRFNDWLLEGKDPEKELELVERIESEKHITMHEFFPVFMKRHGSRQSESMQALYQNCFKNICRCSQIADVPISTISKGLMLKYMHTCIEKDGVTPATVNREASFVRGMLSRATDWEILSVNPLNGLRLLKEAEKRQVNLTPDQAMALINELKEPIASIVEFAIFSGFRKDNILGMRIEKICFHDPEGTGEVELKVKGGKTEIFPLGSHAVSLIKRVIGDRKEGYIFCNSKTGTRYSYVHKPFDRAVKKLGFTVGGTKLRFHDLRHVFATWLHRKGVGLDVIRPLLGHSNRSTTDRYVTLDRLACGDVLNLLPELRNNGHKKMASTV